MARKHKSLDKEMQLFLAEAEYAESIFCSAVGDIESSIAALKRSLEIKPNYAPALLTLGSIEYQRGGNKKAERLYRTLFSLPEEEEDFWEILDKAGDVLIDHQQYALGLELMEAAVDRFPDQANLYQNLTICASHEGFHEKAMAASEKALELEPNRQALVTNLGWSLYEAGRNEKAEKVLQKAAEMDPEDHLARNNLRICQQAISEKRTR